MTRQRVAASRACPPGECDIGYDSHTNVRRCRVCRFSVQSLVDGARRHPLPGDYRVVCHGRLDTDDTVCPIGPSEATPMQGHAIELYNAHQRAAVEADGEPHDAEIIQF